MHPEGYICWNSSASTQTEANKGPHYSLNPRFTRLLEPQHSPYVCEKLRLHQRIDFIFTTRSTVELYNQSRTTALRTKLMYDASYPRHSGSTAELMNSRALLPAWSTDLLIIQRLIYSEAYDAFVIRRNSGNFVFYCALLSKLRKALNCDLSSDHAE